MKTATETETMMLYRATISISRIMSEFDGDGNLKEANSIEKVAHLTEYTEIHKIAEDIVSVAKNNPFAHVIWEVTCGDKSMSGKTCTDDDDTPDTLAEYIGGCI